MGEEESVATPVFGKVVQAEVVLNGSGCAQHSGCSNDKKDTSTNQNNIKIGCCDSTKKRR